MTLQVKHLYYTYEQNLVLKKLNLKLNKGKIYAILGANGSGKSTLLKLLAGLLDPDKGQVLINNELVKGPQYKLIPGHPDIALVKQDNSLFPLHTVRENLQYILQSHKQHLQTQKISILSKLLNLNHNLDRVFKYLSGGEQQRVAIAVALASNPQYLLLDEPFSHTDMYLKQGMKSHLKQIVEDLGIGIIYVTHEPYDALGFADEIIVLDKGKILEKGTSHQLYYFPKHKNTAILSGYCNWLDENQYGGIAHLHTIKNQILVRPDQIFINPANNHNAFKAVIEKIDFHGVYQLMHLKLENSTTILASQISNSSAYKVGQHIKINFKVMDKVNT